MMKIRYLFLISSLMTTSASAAIVVKGVDGLSDLDKEKVFGTLIQRKHDVENEEQINADLAAKLPGKNLSVYWVPDTLYQVIQTYFDIDGLDGKGSYTAKQARESPDRWKTSKKLGDTFKDGAKNSTEFKYYIYPTTLEEHKAVSPSVIEHWVRFNAIADKELEDAKFRAQGSEYALSKIFRIMTFGLRVNDQRNIQGILAKNDWKVSAPIYDGRVAHLKDNASFLKYALKVEEQAHREGKLLFWRYTQPLAGDMPDLPFKVQENSIEATLGSPLEYYKTDNYGMNSQKFSYAARLLDGYFGDGRVYDQPVPRMFASACTFSFLASDVAAKKNGHTIPDPILYSLVLSPEEVKELNDKRYLYHPREAMPQHQGIYGTGEGFHPAWFLGDQTKENVTALLEILRSDALQVHMIKGALQEDFKNNAEAVRIRNIYNQILEKVRNELVVTLNPTGVSLSTEKGDLGKVTVVTDNNTNASYQLESNRLAVEEDNTINVPYSITVQPGGKMSFGLLNSARNGWYGDELVLGEGTHEGIYKRRVPVGEKEASIVFRNYHLGTPGQTTFTINKLDIEQKSPLLRLRPTGIPAAYAKDLDGKITVVTDNNASASYQLESNRFAVVGGNSIKIPYNITVQPGGKMSFGLLNSARNGWYGDELVLGEGTHVGTFERTVPAGEKETSVVFRNYHLETPGQTTFTINEFDVF